MKKLIVLALMVPTVCFGNINKWDLMKDWIGDLKQSYLEALQRPFYSLEDRCRFTDGVILIDRIFDIMDMLDREEEVCSKDSKVKGDLTLDITGFQK